jgi:hypothetical protein
MSECLECGKPAIFPASEPFFCSKDCGFHWAIVVAQLDGRTAIDAAVAAEREACAKIAEEDAVTGDWPPAAQTAAKIRDRSNLDA